jgi:hypothetical protein
MSRSMAEGGAMTDTLLLVQALGAVLIALVVDVMAALE